jgi:uracil-DNA glycosylase
MWPTAVRGVAKIDQMFHNGCAERDTAIPARDDRCGTIRQEDHLPAQPLSELISSDWAAALEPAAGTVAQMGRFLRGEVADGRGYLPAGNQVLRAFTKPLADIKVLILGQDPYPTRGHPVGLSFSVASDVSPIPRSLANIYTELKNDLGIAPAGNGDLSPWFDQGVLLLNRVLTVQPGKPASHRGKGWEQVTQLAIERLAARGGPLVAILWGRDAQSLKPMLGSVPSITSPHPSPMSADRGFFGSKPFSRANDVLIRAGGDPIDWHIDR